MHTCHYVCMYMYTYTGENWKHSTFLVVMHTSDIYTRTRTYMYTCTYRHIQVGAGNIRLFLSLCIHMTSIHVHVHICIHVHIHIYKWVLGTFEFSRRYTYICHIRTYTYIYVYMYIYTYAGRCWEHSTFLVVMHTYDKYTRTRTRTCLYMYIYTYAGGCWEHSTFLVVFGTSRFPVSLRWHFARVFLCAHVYVYVFIILYVLGVFIYFAGKLEFVFLGFVFSCVCMVALCLGVCTDMKKVQKVQLCTHVFAWISFTHISVYLYR